MPGGTACRSVRWRTSPATVRTMTHSGKRPNDRAFHTIRRPVVSRKSAISIHIWLGGAFSRGRFARLCRCRTGCRTARRHCSGNGGAAHRRGKAQNSGGKSGPHSAGVPATGCDERSVLTEPAPQKKCPSESPAGFFILLEKQTRYNVAVTLFGRSREKRRYAHGHGDGRGH